ncbi:magnesium transporter [Sporosarcina sp. 179-K 3D1 HS]
MEPKMDEVEVARALIQVLKEGKKDTFHDIIKELDSYEIARQYKDLPQKRRPLFLEFLTIEELTTLLKYLNQDEQLSVLEMIGYERATDILELMQSDELAFLFTGLSKSKVDRLIAHMKREQMEEILHILDYPPKTAGRAMNNRYITVRPDATVEEAEQELKKFQQLAKYLNYIYITNKDRKLVGVVSYRDLILSDPQSRISEIMTTKLVKADVLMKQEQVARLIGKYDFESVPVVDQNNVLLGAITVENVLDIVVREANEDIEMLLASGKSIDFRTRPLVAAKRRLPWLLLLLFIGLVSGSIISKFEETLEAVVALAFFMPMIAGMTGNTGTQSLAVVVRGLVSEDVDMKKSLKLLFRELVVGVLIGITCAVVISIIAYVWQGSFILGLVVGASLLATLIIGTLAGTVIPLILNKFKVDPAVASGPLITTVNDILSLLIYFGIATMFLSKLT